MKYQRLSDGVLVTIHPPNGSGSDTNTKALSPHMYLQIRQRYLNLHFCANGAKRIFSSKLNGG